MTYDAVTLNSSSKKCKVEIQNKNLPGGTWIITIWH